MKESSIIPARLGEGIITIIAIDEAELKQSGVFFVCIVSNKDGIGRDCLVKFRPIVASTFDM